jgi:hypothetical protein
VGFCGRWGENTLSPPKQKSEKNNSNENAQNLFGGGLFVVSIYTYLLVLSDQPNAFFVSLMVHPFLYHPFIKALHL